MPAAQESISLLSGGHGCNTSRPLLSEQAKPAFCFMITDEPFYPDACKCNQLKLTCSISDVFFGWVDPHVDCSITQGHLLPFCLWGLSGVRVWGGASNFLKE